MSITHHDGCFGCGLANLFGLQMELDSAGADEVRGRFFVKQDHQGPPGVAHGGVVVAALDEAMALLLHDKGIRAVTSRLEIELARPAPVGEFVEVSARIAGREGRRIELVSEARGSPGVLARALGVFVEVERI